MIMNDFEHSIKYKSYTYRVGLMLPFGHFYFILISLSPSLTRGNNFLETGGIQVCLLFITSID